MRTWRFVFGLETTAIGHGKWGIMRYTKQVIVSLTASVLLFGCASQDSSHDTPEKMSWLSPDEKARMADHQETKQRKSEEWAAAVQKAEEEATVRQKKAEEEPRAQKEREDAARRRAEEEKAGEETQSVSVRVGYMTYTVWKSHWTRDNFGTNTRRLEVQAAAKNRDRQPQRIPPFMLVDEQGREYETADIIPSTFLLSVLDTLNPSVQKQGFIVFDVPSDRTYKLKVSGGYGTNEYEYIPLQPQWRR